MCFSGEGDLGGVLMYEFVMVALEVCLYYTSVYLC